MRSMEEIVSEILSLIMYMYMSHPRQQFFFERLLPWDLICLSQVSEYLHVYIHVQYVYMYMYMYMYSMCTTCTYIHVHMTEQISRQLMTIA